MKKNSIRKKFGTLIVLLMVAMMAVSLTGCVANGGTQDLLEATQEEKDTAPELRRIGIRTIVSIPVNTESAAVGFYFAGETEFVKPEDEAYETLVYTVTAYDGNGKELAKDMLKYEMGDSGVLNVTVKELGRIDVHVESTITDYEANASVNVVRQSLNVWDIIILGIGLYVLYLGIVGRGQIYESEFIKEGKELHYKMIIRVCCIIVSICMVASGIIAAVDTYGSYKMVKTILFIAAIAIFIAGIIATGNMTDKQAKKEAEV